MMMACCEREWSDDVGTFSAGGLSISDGRDAVMIGKRAFRMAPNVLRNAGYGYSGVPTMNAHQLYKHVYFHPKYPHSQ